MEIVSRFTEATQTSSAASLWILLANGLPLVSWSCVLWNFLLAIFVRCKQSRECALLQNCIWNCALILKMFNYYEMVDVCKEREQNTAQECVTFWLLLLLSYMHTVTYCFVVILFAVCSDSTIYEVGCWTRVFHFLVWMLQNDLSVTMFLFSYHCVSFVAALDVNWYAVLLYLLQVHKTAPWDFGKCRQDAVWERWSSSFPSEMLRGIQTPHIQQWLPQCMSSSSYIFIISKVENMCRLKKPKVCHAYLWRLFKCITCGSSSLVRWKEHGTELVNWEKAYRIYQCVCCSVNEWHWIA